MTAIEIIDREVAYWKTQCIFGSVQEMTAAAILEAMQKVQKEIKRTRK